jgi:hypothetical protein
MGNPQQAADRPERTRESSELYNEPAATPGWHIGMTHPDEVSGATAGLKQALEKQWSICAFS